MNAIPRFASWGRTAPARPLTDLAFARRMQHRNHNARVVLITAHPEYRDLEEAAPFGGVLFKVQDAGALVTGLHERLGLGTTWTAT